MVYNYHVHPTRASSILYLVAKVVAHFPQAPMKYAHIRICNSDFQGKLFPFSSSHHTFLFLPGLD